MIKKKEISFRQFMQLQIRFIIFKCNTKGLDYLEAAELYAADFRAKIESKYIIK